MDLGAIKSALSTTAMAQTRLRVDAQGYFSCWSGSWFLPFPLNPSLTAATADSYWTDAADRGEKPKVIGALPPIIAAE